MPPTSASKRPSDDARYAAEWILDSGDHQGRPFAIVDKRAARIYVFDTAADGTLRLTGASPVLIGLASGDFAIPDIAQRTPASLRPDERTTPAGRFDTEPGHQRQGRGDRLGRLRGLARESTGCAPRRRSSVAAIGSHRRMWPITASRTAASSCRSSSTRPSSQRPSASAAAWAYVLPESRSVRAMFGAFELGKAVVPQTEVR